MEIPSNIFGRCYKHLPSSWYNFIQKNEVRLGNPTIHIVNKEIHKFCALHLETKNLLSFEPVSKITDIRNDSNCSKSIITA